MGNVGFDNARVNTATVVQSGDFKDYILMQISKHGKQDMMVLVDKESIQSFMDQHGDGDNALENWVKSKKLTLVFS
ncbi:MAG: hypothetical protein KKG59_03880 [Nanoarchaeota archaeon]|nr:hypothetical protein [Nanoarchaeota archaeon]